MLLPSIEAWHRHHNVSNVAASVIWTMERKHSPIQLMVLGLSIFVTHIILWSDTVVLFANMAKVLKQLSCFEIYAAFNRNGHFTSESNKEVISNISGGDTLHWSRRY
jgi:hypothetical protein